ncbi:hypothetical protein JCGZ_04565 [Jatropha curcas]|uniref:Uncharacterized protein n=1 Tax=Jatropha curcas TaxID=180498 RepID=A0A067LDR9_JATCU|nr:hypothetical protein JCGZ_04565 [Jatropha curcas]
MDLSSLGDIEHFGVNLEEFWKTCAFRPPCTVEKAAARRHSGGSQEADFSSPREDSGNVLRFSLGFEVVN